MLTRVRIGFFTALTAAALLMGAQEARANDQDLKATTVPATSCQPATHAQAAEVVLSNAAWVFSGTNTGTVTFYCPLPLNTFTKSDALDDNDISQYRVYYRDTDGMGIVSEVTVQLMYRSETGLTLVGSEFTSNDSNETDNTVRPHAVIHDVNPEALYSFAVRLSRIGTAHNPAFAGIDFYVEAIP